MRARASAATKPSGSAHYKGRMGCVPIMENASATSAAKKSGESTHCKR